jgi:hypothetical protein
MTFLHSVFGLAVRKGWAPSNPVEDAARPKRRRSWPASVSAAGSIPSVSMSASMADSRASSREAPAVMADGTAGIRAVVQPFSAGSNVAVHIRPKSLRAPSAPFIGDEYDAADLTHRARRRPHATRDA